MTADEIEDVLGHDAVAAVERAINAAFVASRERGEGARGALALQELLITMQAAAIITPPEGAIERADEVARRLVDVVSQAVLAERPSGRPF